MPQPHQAVPTSSLGRAAAIMDCLRDASADGLTLTTISHRTGVPRTGTRRILEQLTGLGWVAHRDTGFGLDALLDRLGAAEFDLVAIGRLHLAEPALAAVLRENGPLPTFDRDRHERCLH